VKRVVGLTLAWILFGVFVFYATFFIGFYVTFNGPTGYSCEPTLTFGYKCVGPDGKVYSNR
jgi:hypothetical protein